MISQKCLWPPTALTVALLHYTVAQHAVNYFQIFIHSFYIPWILVGRQNLMDVELVSIYT
jgi:hypothetical protein